MEDIMQERKEEYDNLLASKSFKDREHIYSTYNESVLYYEKYRKASELMHVKDAADNLSIAAMKLAVVVEWAAKNLVYYYYYNKMQIYGSTHSDYEKWEKITRFKNVDNGRNMSTHDLFQLIRASYSTQILEKQLVFDNMDDKNVRMSLINGYKHEGIIPNATSYLLTLNETYNFLKNLLDGQIDISLKSITDSYPDSWEELFYSCSYFIPGKSKHFVLLTDGIESIDVIRNIFKIDWDLVLDFSYQDEENHRVSLYDQYQSLEEHRGVNLKYLCDIRPNESLPALAQGYWIKLNGKLDAFNKDEILLEDKDLARSYINQNFADLLNAFTGEYTLPVDLIVLNCANYKNSTFRIIQQFDDMYYREHDLTVHIMNCENNFLTDKIDMYSGAEVFKRYDLTMEQLANAICNNFRYQPIISDLVINIPHSSQGRGIIQFEEYQSMKSVFDLIYIGIEKQYDKETQDDRANDFLHGECKVDWDLVENEEYVIQQKNELSIKDEISKEIQENKRSIYTIDYQAGIGGTTFLRRLAFLFHKQYPTAILTRYIETTTLEFLLEIYMQSYKEVIIFADSNDISYNEILKLQEELGQKSEFTYEIVYVARKDLLIQDSNSIKMKPYMHLTRLNYQQCLTMQKNLNRYIKKQKCRENLAQCVDKAKNGFLDEEHIPFVLALYAFDEDFNGIVDYVKHSLEHLTEKERDIIFVLSLAGFANYRVDINYFRSLYGETTVRLMNREDYRLYPLIRRISDNTSKRQGFQIRYSLFIKEILKYYSGGENILFNNLLGRIIAIIQGSRKNIYCRKNADVVKLFNKLFIERADKQDGDYDVKGTYSPLISKLIEESRLNNNREYDGSENSVVRVFKCLATTYPDEPHFAAHLARYYFYNTNNYQEGFETIQSAIKMAESIEGVSMGSLYHIKAMGYSARIQNDFIKSIRESMRHYKKDNENKIDINHIKKDLNSIDVDMQNATYNFDISRYESSSRFISNIAECRLILNVQVLYDDLKEFCVSNNLDNMIEDSKTINLYDKLESMIEDCEKMLAGEKGVINAYNESLLRNIQDNEALVKANADEIRDVCKQLIASGNSDLVAIARRKLARINYNEVYENPDVPESQAKLREIISMMEANFNEDIANNANFRIWFKALRYLETNDVENTLEDILTKLEQWTSEPNAPADAFYYKYIVKFILAYEQNTLEHDIKVRDDLKKMLYDLQQAAIKMPRRTIPFEWFSDYHKGLRRLISSNELSDMDRTSAISSLKMFRGALPGKDYFKTRTAYISYKGLPVYFNPQSIIDRITSSSENKYVKFGMGFSYDGLRSYHDSIELYKGNIEPDTKIELRKGLVVSVMVKYINNTNVIAEILGTSGSTVRIRHKDLISIGYDSDNLPKLGSEFRVKLLGEKNLDNGQKVWDGTTTLSERKENDEPFNRPFADLKIDFE